MQLCSIGELATILGVAVITLRRWDKAGLLTPVCRTLGGHRRYDLAEAQKKLGLATQTEKLTIAYARVSSSDQSEQLQTQALRLQRHCEEQNYPNLEVISDLGSGMEKRQRCFE